MSAFTIDPILYEGRPADCTGRDPREIACYDLLDRLGVPFSASIMTKRPQSSAAPPWKRGWVPTSAKTCFCATDRKRSFTFC